MENTTRPQPVKVFIGSGEASLLERKTLIYSLRKHSRSPLDIYVFNGTHDSIERNDEPPIPAGMSLRVKYKNFTEFSNYRFMIPQICDYTGRAIFLDSDTICLADIAGLFNAPMGEDCAVLAKCEAYAGTGGWWRCLIAAAAASTSMRSSTKSTRGFSATRTCTNSRRPF